MTTDLIELEDTIELDLTAYQIIRATIKSSEPVTLDAVDSDCDAITYSLGASLKFGGFYYTVVMIDVDQEKALEYHNEYFEDHEAEDITEWNGNVFESGYWGSPECALVEDNVCPAGYQDEVEIEYLCMELTKMTKTLNVTFEVTALVSPEEFAKWMGYPDGSPENEIRFDEWDQEEFQECITTFGDWNRFFKITGRTVRKVEESDLPFDDDEREAMIEQNIERGVPGPESWE